MDINKKEYFLKKVDEYITSINTSDKETLNKIKKELIEIILSNNKISEIFNSWWNGKNNSQIDPYNIKKTIIDNLPIFIDIITADENAEYLTSFKISDSGNIQKVFIPSPSVMSTTYTKNFWLTEISDINITEEKDLLPYVYNAFVGIQKTIKEKKQNNFFVVDTVKKGKKNLFDFLANYFARNNLTVASLGIPTLQNYLFSYLKELKLTTKYMVEVDVLFLDNLGSERTNNWFLESVIFEVINQRIKNNKITFISSNYSFADLLKIYNNNKSTTENIKIKTNLDKIKFNFFSFMI